MPRGKLVSVVRHQLVQKLELHLLLAAFSAMDFQVVMGVLYREASMINIRNKGLNRSYVMVRCGQR